MCATKKIIKPEKIQQAALLLAGVSKLLIDYLF
jgi:hypothetical protein